jgi:hypothetical protein
MRQTRRTPALWLDDTAGVERALICSNNACGMPQGKLGVQQLRALHGCKIGLLRTSKLLSPCALCHTEAPCALCHTEARVHYVTLKPRVHYVTLEWSVSLRVRGQELQKT